MNLSELSAIGICIDEYNDGEMKGRIYSPTEEEALNFNSAITLVKTINKIFDEGDYPQATMRVRGFNKPQTSERSDATKPNLKTVSDPRRVFKPHAAGFRGKKATFNVKVMFRQNASWQGVLCWIEKNREESFRSVLEMMMLIDSTFEAERAALNNSKDEQLAGNM